MVWIWRDPPGVPGIRAVMMYCCVHTAASITQIPGNQPLIEPDSDRRPWMIIKRFDFLMKQVVCETLRHQQLRSQHAWLSAQNNYQQKPQRARFILVLQISRGGSRIPRRRGRQPSGGAPTYEIAKFSETLHEIEKILGHSGDPCLLHPPNPPLISDKFKGGGIFA